MGVPGEGTGVSLGKGQECPQGGFVGVPGEGTRVSPQEGTGESLGSFCEHPQGGDGEHPWVPAGR